MFKLILLFNTKKLIVGQEMEKLNFYNKHRTLINTNIPKLRKDIEKLTAKKQTEKNIVEVSKLQAKLVNIIGDGTPDKPGVVNIYKSAEAGLAHHREIVETIKQNFWKLF